MEVRQTTYPLGEEDAALARGALDRGLDKRVSSEGKHLRGLWEGKRGREREGATWAEARMGRRAWMGKPLDVHTGSEGSRLRMHVDDYVAVVYESRRPRPSPHRPLKFLAPQPV